MLFLTAFEGIICIIMALPLAIFFVWIGSVIGYFITRTAAKNALPHVMILIFLAIPFMSFAEKERTPEINSVTTSVIINAPAEKVWQNVIEFPPLNKPKEFIFKTGIAYPENATIEGKGVGAVRHCNFTTGSFVEPITVWRPPYLLKFDVRTQPASMKEISLWDVKSAHINGYFISKKGQFKLTKLSNGNTLLEGTTWYYNNIYPQFYWNIWSDYIIHKIHLRVLNHIQKNSERQ